MPFGKAKVYSDGNHYIAIPKEMQISKKKNHKSNISLKQKQQMESDATKSKVDSEVMATAIDIKGLFESLYKEYYDKKPRQQVEEISKGLESCIENEKERKEFVKKELERKRRNAIARKIRLYRKVNLNEWHYFCTFTYDDKKQTEDSFRTKLSNVFKHLSNRKGWKYIGVWERSPENNRLHFHALVYTPTMIGTFETKKDFSTKNNKMQIANQNSYFLERFGRNDFRPINPQELSQTVKYLTKYMEKTGEKIIYSRNIATYFISDIFEEDIVCTIGNENRKLLLFDDFKCWDEGVLIGNVSKEVIEQMPKCN